MATQLATVDQQSQQTAAVTPAQQNFQLMQRKAQLFATSPLIPETLRAGGPQQALANCYIGLTIAEAMNENPLTVLQNIHVVKGKAGFSAQFMIARANASGVFKGRIGWREEGRGDALSVTAYATLADTGEEVSFTVDMAMAKAEGWTSNPKYKSIPHLMLRYRSATFLVRLYAPDVMFGYQTAEEVEDIAAAATILAPQPVTAQALLEQASAEEEGPSDEQRGEAHNGLDDVVREMMAEIDARTTIIDVNSYISGADTSLLSDDEAAEVRAYAAARVEELKARG